MSENTEGTGGSFPLKDISPEEIVWAVYRSLSQHLKNLDELQSKIGRDRWLTWERRKVVSDLRGYERIQRGLANRPAGLDVKR